MKRPIRFAWMRNTLVYPVGIGITYQKPEDPFLPNSFAINFLLWSLVFWPARPTELQK